MTRTPSFAAPTRIDASSRPLDHWADPAHGTIGWRTLISAGLTPTEGLVCGIAEMQPGQHFALHRHAEPEVYFGLEGHGEVMIDGAAHHLSPGVAIYIPGHAEHGVPNVATALKWFYVFARDSFDQITYEFTQNRLAVPQSRQK